MKSNEKRLQDDRRANLIEFALDNIRNHNWLSDDDLTVLEDVFALISHQKRQAWYEVSSLLSTLTSKDTLATESGARAALLVARIENYADAHEINISADTRGHKDYSGWVAYARHRKPAAAK